MNSRARRRLALGIAAAAALTTLTAKPLHACDSTRGCPSNTANLQGVAANALPTYPQPTEEKAAQEKVAEPIALKKFTKSQSRTARRAQSRKASASQRARASKDAAGKAEQPEQDQSSERAKVEKPDKKVAPTIADAHAKLLEAEAATAVEGEPAQAVATQSPTEPSRPAVEVVSSEEFNDLDRLAWEANQMPKLMQLTIGDSRAELHDDDSKWAHTSMIGKLFVAFGALLTVGSAVRMFMT